MAREVTLVDAGLGNLASVERALIQVGAGVRVTDDPDKVATSRMVVFPGQSAFGAATQAVVDGAMGAALRMVIERGDPFLGICLGMQLLFDGSDENGGQEGLHVLPGRCRRFPYGLMEEAEPGAVERHMLPASAKPEHIPVLQSLTDDSPEPEASDDGGMGLAYEPTAIEAVVVPPPPDWSGPTVEEVGHGTTITTEELPDVAALRAAAALAGPGTAAPLLAPTPATAPATAVVEPMVAEGEPMPAEDGGERPQLMRRVKVPHMGWNEVEPTGDHYYFVHSFYVEPARMEDVMWISRYGGIRFPAAVRRGNVMGCQFHPEKSQRAGLRFLRAFLLGGWG